MAHAVEDDLISNTHAKPRRKALRRLVLPATLAALMLVVTQVVLAAPPGNPGFTASPSSPQVNQDVTFTSTVTDPDGDIASWEWDFDYDGSFNAQATGESTTTSFSEGGARTVALRVTDTAGDPAAGGDGTADTLLAIKTVTVTVPNQPPTASFTISPNPAKVGENVKFTGSGDDPDGPPIPDHNYDWDLDGNGTFETSGKEIDRTYSTPGARSNIRLQVTDANGATTATAPQTLNVTNAAPTATITSIAGTNSVTPSVPDVGEQVSFAGTGSDPDGQPIKRFEWDFDYTSGNFTVDATGATTTSLYATAGQRTVAFRSIDSADVASPVATQLLKVNGLPLADVLVQVNPDAREPGQIATVPLVGQQIVLDGSLSSDPNGPGSEDDQSIPVDGYGWNFDGDAEFGEASDPVPDGSCVPGNRSQSVVCTFTKAGPRTLGLRVTDGDEAVSLTRPVAFRVNTAPVAGFVVEPLTPVIGDPVAFSSTSTDADAADSNLTHEWAFDLDRDGSFETSGGSGATANRTFNTAGTYPVRLRVTDTGGITRERIRQIVVQNTIPKGGFTWSPNAPLPNQSVTFKGTASSPTGKPLGPIQWDFDFDPSKDQFDVNATGASVSHSFPGTGTKTIALRVTETGGGYAIVYDRIVVNAPPKASFSISPTSAFVNDSVTLSSSSSDPDGPLVKQEWDLDNDGRFDDANAAVVSAKFKKRGRYPIKLRVTDSKGATATASGEVTVRTRPLAVISGVIVGIKGRLAGARTQIKRLLIRAPKGAKVSVRCRGKNCPKVTRKRSKGAKKLRFKSIERRFRPGTKLIVTITKTGFIGRQTTFTIRRGLEPLRRDLCLTPGAKKAKRCPAP